MVYERTVYVTDRHNDRHLLREFGEYITNASTEFFLCG